MPYGAFGGTVTVPPVPLLPAALVLVPLPPLTVGAGVAGAAVDAPARTAWAALACVPCEAAGELAAPPTVGPVVVCTPSSGGGVKAAPTRALIAFRSIMLTSCRPGYPGTKTLFRGVYGSVWNDR